jgi:hypothetical protein
LRCLWCFEQQEVCYTRWPRQAMHVISCGSSGYQGDVSLWVSTYSNQ